MKIILAIIFRLLFRFNFFKKRYFGLSQKVFKPFKLFKGVVQKIRYHNFKLKLHIDDWVQENLFFLGEYEAAELKTAEFFLKEDSVFIDIGANVGLYTVHLSKIINNKGKIFCFEPFSANFNSLHENIMLNNLVHVQIQKLAIGAQEENIKLYCNPAHHNLGMISVIPMENSYTEEVKSVTLDGFLKLNCVTRIDLIKIDIEGYEYQALCGMKETLTTFKPALLIEILDAGQKDINNVNCENFLKALGYTKYFIGDDGSFSATQVNKHRTNYLFAIANKTEKR